MKNRISYKIINNPITISDALGLLKDRYDTLIITDNKKKCNGTFTMGDFRRAAFEGIDISKNINYLANSNFFYLNKNNVKDAKNIFEKNYDINHIPVLDIKSKIIKVISRSKLSKKNKLKNLNKKTDIIIMAGGKGKRLKPFSSILPKPLMLHDGTTLIEKVLMRFKLQNFIKFHVTLNFQSNLMKAYLSKLKYKIKFITEKTSLGTLGSISLIDKQKFSNPFIVVNSDNTIDYKYERIINFHNEKGSDFTMVVFLKKNVSDYGICISNDNGELVKMLEKPVTQHLVNSGMYIINKNLVKLIKKNSKLDVDKFIKKLISTNKKIYVYPIPESCWRDFGKIDYFNLN